MQCTSKACGLVVDRDYNSAVLKRATVGHTGSNACGVVAMATAMNQEAHLL
jgi:hypothetical protein